MVLRRFLILSYVVLALTIVTADDNLDSELESRDPKTALVEQTIRSRDLELKAKGLLKRAKSIGREDLPETIHYLVNAQKQLALLDTEQPGLRKLSQEVQRLLDDAYVAYYFAPGLKQEGSSVLLDYKGEWLKTHEKSPWMLVTHTMKPSESMLKHEGYLIKGDRCLGVLKFDRVYKEFGLARLAPHWAALYRETNGKAFSDADLKGAKVYVVNPKRQDLLYELSRGRTTVNEIKVALNAPPKVPPEPEAIKKLVLTPKGLRADDHWISDWSADKLKKVLKDANVILPDPLSVSVAWDVPPATVERLAKTLTTTFGIKTVHEIREKRPNGAAEKIKKIKLSRVSLEQTRISTVLEFLKNMSRSMDPEGTGVNVVYLSDNKNRWDKEPRVTLQLKGATIEAGLKKICEQTGMSFRAEPHGVIIGKNLPKTIELPVEYQRKYNDIVLAKMSFMDTRLSTVMEFIEMQCKRSDPYRVGLPLSVTIPKQDVKKIEGPKKPVLPKKTDDDDFPDEGGMDEDFVDFVGDPNDLPADDEPTITVDLDDTPILDALRFVCYQAQLAMTFENGVIVIKPIEKK